MKRRDFFRLLTVSSPILLSSCAALHKHFCPSCINPFAESKPTAALPPQNEVGDLAETQSVSSNSHHPVNESDLHGDGAKSIYFDQDFAEDISCTGVKFELV